MGHAFRLEFMSGLGHGHSAHVECSASIALPVGLDENDRLVQLRDWPPPPPIGETVDLQKNRTSAGTRCLGDRQLQFNRRKSFFFASSLKISVIARS